MTYYVTKANITTAGKDDTDFKSFDSYDAALKFYHLIFSNGISANKKVKAMLTDENLNVIKKEVWLAAEPEPEEE